jgi:hypothetical protein
MTVEDLIKKLELDRANLLRVAAVNDGRGRCDLGQRLRDKASGFEDALSYVREYEFQL